MGTGAPLFAALYTGGSPGGALNFGIALLFGVTLALLGTAPIFGVALAFLGTALILGVALLFVVTPGGPGLAPPRCMPLFAVAPGKFGDGSGGKVCKYSSVVDAEVPSVVGAAIPAFARAYADVPDEVSSSVSGGPREAQYFPSLFNIHMTPTDSASAYGSSSVSRECAVPFLPFPFPLPLPLPLGTVEDGAERHSDARCPCLPQLKQVPSNRSCGLPLPS